MTGKSHEIGIERFDVNLPMRSGLRGVEQHQRAILVRQFDDLRGGDGDAIQVGGMPESDQAHGGVEQLCIRIEVKCAISARRNNLEQGALLAAQLLPGDEVGVVFLIGDEEHIAGFEGKGVRHQVDALGGVAGEDNLFLFVSVEEFGDCDAGIVHLLGHLCCHVVHTAPAASRVLKVVLVHCINDHLGAQALAGGIEIDHAFIREGGKIAAEFLGIHQGNYKR